jgi:hypothetical protein
VIYHHFPNFEKGASINTNVKNVKNDKIIKKIHLSNVKAKKLFPPNIDSSLLTLKPWRISPCGQTLGRQFHESTISTPSNGLVHENLKP